MKKWNYIFLALSFLFYLLIIIFPYQSGNLLVLSFSFSLIYLYILWIKYPNYLLPIYLLFCFRYMFNYQLGEVTFLLLIMSLIYTILTKIFNYFKLSKNSLNKPTYYDLILLLIIIMSFIFDISFYYISIIYFIFFIGSTSFYQLLFHVCISKLKENNIIINNTSSFKNLYKINTIIFNKTGVLTEGDFTILDINTTKEKLFWKYLSYAEETKDDRISKTIKNSDKYQKANLKKRSNYHESFNGLSYKYLTKNILVGNKEFLLEHGVNVYEEELIGTVIYVVENEKIIGSITLSDKINLNNKKIITRLKELGVSHVSIFSKDQDKLTTTVSRALGIKDSYGSLTTLKGDFWLYYLKQIYGDKIAFISNDDIEYDVKVKIKLTSNHTNNDKDDIIVLDSNLNNCAKTFALSKKLYKCKISWFKIVLLGQLLILLTSLLFFTRIWMIALFSLLWMIGWLICFIIKIIKTVKE